MHRRQHPPVFRAPEDKAIPQRVGSWKATPRPSPCQTPTKNSTTLQRNKGPAMPQQLAYRAGELPPKDITGDNRVENSIEGGGGGGGTGRR